MVLGDRFGRQLARGGGGRRALDEPWNQRSCPLEHGTLLLGKGVVGDERTAMKHPR
jgi:hypothetical protein